MGPSFKHYSSEVSPVGQRYGEASRPRFRRCTPTSTLPIARPFARFWRITADRELTRTVLARASKASGAHKAGSRVMLPVSAENGRERVNSGNA